MPDVHSSDTRSYNMSHIKGKDTKPEILVRKYLFSKGFRYRINDKRYPGRPDIILPKYKTVIFINGCFWHVHEKCKYFVWPSSNVEFWKDKLGRNKKRDEKNIAELKNMGWRVIIVWECELRKPLAEMTLKNLCNEIRNNCV
ncbi:MAG: DNA mismatch endonuclease Vsr [Clostridiaceae bacterium]|nr:DNA mismatch endonuclease Vsr [Clostridiaceae bacterium]